eukprot:scaffold13557_cov63-Phaeocystis_antarctica.AAC.1
MAPGAPGPPGAPAPRATMFSSPTTSRWRMLASSKSVSSPPGNTLGKLMQSLYEPVAGKVTVRLASLITPLINSETVSAPEQVWSPAGKKTAFSPSLTSPPLKVITLSTPTWISLGSNSTPPALRIGTLSGMLMSSALSLRGAHLQALLRPGLVRDRVGRVVRTVHAFLHAARRRVVGAEEGCDVGVAHASWRLVKRGIGAILPRCSRADSQPRVATTIRLGNRVHERSWRRGRRTGRRRGVDDAALNVEGVVVPAGRVDEHTRADLPGSGVGEVLDVQEGGARARAEPHAAVLGRGGPRALVRVLERGNGRPGDSIDVRIAVELLPALGVELPHEVGRVDLRAEMRAHDLRDHGVAEDARQRVGHDGHGLAGGALDAREGHVHLQDARELVLARRVVGGDELVDEAVDVLLGAHQVEEDRLRVVAALVVSVVQHRRGAGGREGVLRRLRRAIHRGLPGGLAAGKLRSLPRLPAVPKSGLGPSRRGVLTGSPTFICALGPCQCPRRRLVLRATLPRAVDGLDRHQVDVASGAVWAAEARLPLGEEHRLDAEDGEVDHVARVHRVVAEHGHLEVLDRLDEGDAREHGISRGDVDEVGVVDRVGLHVGRQRVDVHAADLAVRRRRRRRLGEGRAHLEHCARRAREVDVVVRRAGARDAELVLAGQRRADQRRHALDDAARARGRACGARAARLAGEEEDGCAAILEADADRVRELHGRREVQAHLVRLDLNRGGRRRRRRRGRLGARRRRGVGVLRRVLGLELRIRRLVLGQLRRRLRLRLRLLGLGLGLLRLGSALVGRGVALLAEQVLHRVDHLGELRGGHVAVG